MFYPSKCVKRKQCLITINSQLRGGGQHAGLRHWRAGTVQAQAGRPQAGGLTVLSPRPSCVSASDKGTILSDPLGDSLGVCEAPGTAAGTGQMLRVSVLITVCVCTFHSTHVKVGGQPSRVGSLLPLCGPQILKSGHPVKHPYLLNHLMGPPTSFLNKSQPAYQTGTLPP